MDLTADLVVSAADAARSSALRGYDAVHCATATALEGSDLVAAAGGGRLLAAWRSAGMNVVDIDDQ
ncbi:hypothetical protein [Mobilicoccus caccae]|uniref:Uncharacterized protein n=1 Tax=Mobilicoccus caccae TaxID=1859295 RepID=A0ABQ6INV9_9MICO|nr:hypothetical protein [Mobilicoccus caccae]GMA39608.1 hypothetical protein GCM10025883_16530 [Mobilicoccus caccae]